MKKIFFLLSIIFFISSFSQELKSNKNIKSDSDFLHTISGISVPIKISDFLREDLRTNSKNDSIITAEYIDKANNSKYSFSIFLSPLDEERLINFYYKSLADKRFTPKELNSKGIYFKNGNYKMLGISGIYKNLDYLVNYRVYDAGFWIFVSEFSQKNNDTISLEKNHDNLVLQINPSKIVEKNPLSINTSVYVAPGIKRDELLARSALSSLFNKVKFAKENYTKYERASGLPENSLEFQMAGINGLIDYKTEKNPNPSKGSSETESMINSLAKLRDAGFVDEFLMEQYHYILISKDENHKFDFKGYENWKKENFVDYDINKKFFVIINTKRRTDLSKDE